MKRKGALALLGTVVVVAGVAAVGVAAYNFGLNNGGNGGHAVIGPMMRGYRGGFGMGVDGSWGIFPAMVLGFVVVVVLVALLVGFGRGTSVPAPGPGPAGSSPAGLRELVEMHDRGALTDEEFAAAKRHLLGL